jgi:hypothetical protein
MFTLPALPTASHRPAGRGLDFGTIGLALALSCLMAGSGGRAMAESSSTPSVIDPSVFILPDEGDDAETVQDTPRSLAFKPIAPKPLMPADLPPSNPLSLRSASGSTRVTFGRDWRAGRDEYRALIEREARSFSIPPALVDAVMSVESRYDPTVIGTSGEIGLMQLMPATARMLGFGGTEAELAAPEINIHYGAKYLAGAWRLAGEDLCTATMKYRAGHGETRFSMRSVDYCVRVRNHLASNGVAVSGTVPQPNLGSYASVSAAPSGTGNARMRGRAISLGGTVNLAALNTRLRALADKVNPRNSP